MGRSPTGRRVSDRPHPGSVRSHPYGGVIATFLASDGTLVIHPEPARFFEWPMVGLLPEDLNFIP